MGPQSITLHYLLSTICELRIGKLEVAPLGVSMAFHANFSGPITMKNPARLGDAVTAYMAGLGSTIPLVETGMPGPFSR